LYGCENNRASAIIVETGSRPKKVVTNRIPRTRFLGLAGFIDPLRDEMRFQRAKENLLEKVADNELYET
jgi:hypothetical protein